MTALIKAFIQSILAAKKFNLQMKLYGAIAKKEKTFKVKITKKQMDLLISCAMRGISDDTELHQAIN